MRADIRVYNTCAGPDYVSQSSDVRPQNFGLARTAPAHGRRFEDLTGFMERPADLAAELLEMGISSMKIWPFDFAASALDGIDISPEDRKAGMAPFEAIRKAHGDRMRIKAELHGIWGIDAAKAICAALESIGPDWVEDPVWMDRMADVAELTASTPVPLAGGETLGGLGQVRDLIAVGRIGTPIIDITWGGGVTFARKVAALAEAFAKPIAFHDCSGPVTLTVSTHLAMATPNVSEQEITRAFYYGWYHECLDRLPPIDRGRIRAPEGDGLGVKLHPDLLLRKDVVIRTTGL